MERTMIIGNLCNDPELKTTANGISVCTFGAEPRWTDNERRMIMDEVKNYPPYLDYPKPYEVKQ